MSKADWFVRRACDHRMLCTDGKWRNMVSADRIKFYASSGRAERYGLKHCKLVDSVSDGSLQTRGTCYAVYPNECVNAVGDICDVSGKVLRTT